MGIGGEARMGYGAVLGFGDETTWGTEAGTATSFLEINSAVFKKSLGGKPLTSLGLGNRGVTRRITTQVDVEGTINWNLHPVQGIKLLKHALMGSVASILVSTPAYAHTFTVGDFTGITEKGLTFKLRPSNDGIDSFNLVGARINSLKISGGIGDPITAEIGVIAKDMTLGAFVTNGAVTFNGASVNPFIFYDATISIDGSAEDIISFEITVPENNLQNDNDARSLGSKTLSVLPPKERTLGLTLTQRFDTTTAWNRFINASAMSITITLDTGVTIGALTVDTFKMQITFPKVYYDTGGPPEVSDTGILKHELTIMPILDTITGGKDVFISLWNSTASY